MNSLRRQKRLNKDVPLDKIRLGSTKFSQNMHKKAYMQDSGKIMDIEEILKNFKLEPKAFFNANPEKKGNIYDNLTKNKDAIKKANGAITVSLNEKDTNGVGHAINIVINSKEACIIDDNMGKIKFSSPKSLARGLEIYLTNFYSQYDQVTFLVAS